MMLDEQRTISHDILVDDIVFSYDRTAVFTGVSMKIERGDFACFVGPNGGGKTTMLKILLGLLAPASGLVSVLGQSPMKARQRVGYVPQQTNFDPQFPANVTDVVLMGILGKGFKFGFGFGAFSRTDKLAADDAIEEIGLGGFGNKPFSSLSGGQKQRVLIARAIVSKPKLLLLDEAMANLDARAGKNFLDLLQRLNDKMTIVLVSHDIGFVSQVVKTVVCIHNTISVHPTAKLTGDMITEIYGQDVRLIRHDHNCAIDIDKKVRQ